MDAFLSLFSGAWLYLALFLFLILCGVGNPIPEDVALITGGYLTFTGVIHFWPTVGVCIAGVLAGDCLLYFFGRKYGQMIIQHPRLTRIIPPERVDRIRINFQKRGHLTILFARFLVGLRSPTFLLSGVMHIRFRTFIFYDSIGALVSVPLFVGLGRIFGNNIEALKHDLMRIEHWVTAGAIILLVLWLFWLWWKSRKEEKEEDIYKPHDVVQR